jgi:hypothetical protein
MKRCLKNEIEALIKVDPTQQKQKEDTKIKNEKQSILVHSSVQTNILARTSNKQDLPAETK